MELDLIGKIKWTGGVNGISILHIAEKEICIICFYNGINILQSANKIIKYHEIPSWQPLLM